MFDQIHENLWKIKMYVLEQQRKRRYSGVLQKINKYKDIHNGKRCFVIGTGPSLTAEDLTKLSGEHTFASNGIFRYFDKTDWRPEYYAVCDKTYFRANRDMCLSVAAKGGRFFPLDFIPNFGLFDSDYYFSRVAVRWKNTSFSKNPTSGLSEGSTITYFLMQLAAFMGFSEIYLLGIDFNYSVVMDKNGNVIKNEEVKDYAYDDKAANYTIPSLDLSYISYQAAFDYCKEHPELKIYNATRGGKLEIFRRVNFDEIIGRVL